MPKRHRVNEKLARLLLEMPAAARATLVRQIERAHLRGERGSINGVILEAARNAFRLSGEHPPRLLSAQRRLFVPAEPFLIDLAGSTKQTGRIVRGSLSPIWIWLFRDLLPNDLPPLAAAYETAVLGNDEAQADQLGDRLVALVADALSAKVAVVSDNPEARRKLAAQLGGERVLADAVDLSRLLPMRAALAQLFSNLPKAIATSEPIAMGEHLSAIDGFARAHPDGMVYGLAALQSRLSDPTRIVLYACLGAETCEPAELAKSPLSPAIDLAIAVIDESVAWLRTTLQPGGDANDSLAALCGYHSRARLLTTMVDVDATTHWRHRLSACRREASDLIRGLICEAPSLSRRVIHPTGGRSGAGLPFDAFEAQRAAFLASLIAAARKCAESLALNAVLAEMKSTLEPRVEAAIEELVDHIRRARNGNPVLLQRAEAAIEISSALFGEDYAAFLRRSIASAQAAQKAAG